MSFPAASITFSSILLVTSQHQYACLLSPRHTLPRAIKQFKAHIAVRGCCIVLLTCWGNRLNTQQTMAMFPSESPTTLPDLCEQIIASVLDALELALKSGHTVAVRDLDSSHQLYRMRKQLRRCLACNRHVRSKCEALLSEASLLTCSIRSDMSCIHLPFG